MWQTDQFYSVYQEDALHLINTQIGTVNYLLPPIAPRKRIPDASTFTNEELWTNLLPPKELYRAGMTLSLEQFFLFEWFPRAPGLYFTREGKQARLYAREFLRRVAVPRKSGTHMLDTNRKDREFLDIYDPYGKISMLKGGVGCIRLRPKVLDGGTAWFLSASSTGVAHEGFPVAIPDHLFQRYIDSIKSAGALRCTLRGKLQFLPDPVAELYREYRGVPQLYLLVETLIPETNQDHEHLLVSAGISFMSSFEGMNKMYASYATFDAAVSNSVDEIVDWLQEVYVQGLYGGRVITDFDEQMTHFPNATFSLRNVMNNQLDREAVQTVVQTMNLYAADTAQLFTGLSTIGTIQIERVERMEQNKTINIGSGATITAPVVIADHLQESFNVLEQSGADKDLKDLLNRLLQAVAGAARLAPSPAAENAARDSRNLIEEATAKAPRPGEGVRLGERIMDWAKAIGETGKPVVELAAAIIPLLPH
ncbi:hypothetical protein H7849_17185 [Alloacidobacterium dinghuense]|uniref:Uncharacterized protein n=1 Tax=Alloacidobacterium dinghuense TaxID=2763107 RepID=A0A7G8BE70_9BACT|nr:hypothetical protein [Alloacidobacterium dinghuense]QNI30840.1 hypothetical protein H7849_17185 [Alloacidobacterium dinghuense]